MSYRFTKSGSRLYLSAKRKTNKGQNLAEWRKKQQENNIYQHTEQLKDEYSQQVQLHEDIAQFEDENSKQVQLHKVEDIETPQPQHQQTTIQSSSCVLEQNIVHKDRPIYNCKICKTQYKSKKLLDFHAMKHKIGKTYICDVCYKKFSEKKRLINHYLIHTHVSHLCTVCNHHFSDESALRDHSLIHAGVRPFVCDICKKAFWRKVSLSNHYLVHFPEGNYKCKICNKTFAKKSSLRIHDHVHSKDKLGCINGNRNVNVKVNATPQQKQQQFQEETQIAIKQQCYNRNRLNNYNDEISQCLYPRYDQTASFAYESQGANLMSCYGFDQELQQIKYKMNNNNVIPESRHLVGSNKQDDNKQESSKLPSYDNTIIKMEIDIENHVKEQASTLLDNSTIKAESPFLQLDATLNEQS